MKLTFLPALLTLAVSCRTAAVFHPASPSPPPAAGDTVITLQLTYDRVPLDSAYFLGAIDFRLTPKSIRPGLDSLRKYCRAEARKHGGNVLKLKHAEFGFDALTLKWDLYAFPPEAFVKLRLAKDSADSAYRATLTGLAIVHLLDRDDIGHTSISFGDSLLTTMRGVGFDGVRKPGRASFRFDRPGRLTIGDTTHIDIVTGQEYYIVLYTLLGRHQFYHRCILTDKDGFENPRLLYFPVP